MSTQLLVTFAAFTALMTAASSATVYARQCLNLPTCPLVVPHALHCSLYRENEQLQQQNTALKQYLSQLTYGVVPSELLEDAGNAVLLLVSLQQQKQNKCLDTSGRCNT